MYIIQLLVATGKNLEEMVCGMSAEPMGVILYYLHPSGYCGLKIYLIIGV